MGTIVGGLVVDDDGEAAEERQDAEEVKRGVGVCADAFLRGSVRGLEHEDCLGDEEETGGVEELWKGRRSVCVLGSEEADIRDVRQTGSASWITHYPR